MIVVLSVLFFGGLPANHAKVVPTLNAAGSVQQIRAEAERGHADTQTNLGFMYWKGQGVPQDYNQAAAWYRKAAEQGYANAQYNLGVVYGKGQGVPQDYGQASAMPFLNHIQRYGRGNMPRPAENGLLRIT